MLQKGVEREAYTSRVILMRSAIDLKNKQLKELGSTLKYFYFSTSTALTETKSPM